MERLLLIVSLFCLSSCTYVPLQQGAEKVRVVAVDAISSCENLGEITASTTDRIAVVDRNRLKVLDEVETAARNQAAQMGANTIAPLSELDSGERRYGAYKCRP
jgi:Domain of unknown function (DUF4156)